MKFTTIFNDHIKTSITHLFNNYGVPRSLIEIGVFEGYTTFNLVDSIVPIWPDYLHYAIDPHGDSDDLPDQVVLDAGRCFKDNLETFSHKAHIEYMPMTSWQALTNLIYRGLTVDFIYVDGDHRASTVLEDLVLGFHVLKPGGIMLCDDAIAWRHQDLVNNPKLAVDNFIQCNWPRIEILEVPNGYQIAIRKIKI